ncbi:MAG: cytochrome P450 [Novosphingobium sp.]|nr:cytochrome P450 [Novosphingobium sp.]MCP5402510.1 cytochrome P450 [Novosphingobium sp.]
MQTITELALPYLPMEEASFAENPWPGLEAARRQHPWLSRCAFGYAVHQYDAMRDLLYLDRSLTGAYEDVVDAMEAHGTPWGRFQLESLLASSGESHKRIRAVLAPAFTPQQANRHRPLMRKVISDLLDEWVPKGAFDFEEFASYFPITVMCSLIGAPPEVIPRLRSSLEAFGLSMSMDRAFLPNLVEATETLDAFVQDLVAERRGNRRAKGKEDLLEILVSTQESGGLSERELYDLLIFLFVAGYDTSKNALTLMMDALIDRPDIYRRCAEDIDYCRKVVEESFRFLTTATIPRRVTRDITYRDVLIPEGTVIFFPVSIAGRDATAIEEADSFDPDREQSKKHLAFGMGVHICLGQFIARAQIEEGLHLIAQRIRNPKRAGPSSWRPFFGVWGLKGLPIEFDPAPALETVD